MALFLKNSNNNQNAQVATTQRAQRSSSPQNYTTQITTTKGTQYTLDNNQVNWIKSRYKQDGADTYGWDDADQYAKQTGQLSAKMRSTYKNSNVDRQLAEMGLPSEKNLEKYIADYQNWHTGGIGDYFGKDVPQDFYTKTKDMFKGDWQYDDTQEDQLRKSSGQMPSKLAAKYTDTEIDDELRAAGLPPVAEMGKYIGRYNNYSAIDNLYKNAAVAWANLGLSQDENGQYIQNDNKVYTMEDGRQRKGKDLYAEAFYDELRRRDEKGDYVYGNIFGMFKNNHLEDYDPDDYDGTNYNQYLGKEFVNASKVADLADDYAAYTAFSYDDFAGKYGDYYDKFLKNYKFSDGQTLEEKMKGIAIKNDEQAQREFYDVSDKWFDKGRGTSDFVARYKQMYPNNTYEQMFTDMFENGVPESTVRKTMTTLRNDTSVTGGKNWADDKMSGFKDLTNAYANARQKFMSKQRVNEEAIAAEAEELTAEDAVRRIEDYMSESGGWTAENATKAMDALVKAGVSTDTIRNAVADMRAQFGDSEYKDAMDALGAYELKEGPEVFDEFTVKKYQKELRAAQRDARKQYAEDEATIQTAYDAIDKMLTGLVATDEGVASVNDVIAVLDSIESASWNNPVSMEKALERYGFVGNGQFTGLAEKLTKNWSNDDKLKLFYNIGSVRTADVDPENNDFIEKFTDIFGGDWLKFNEAPVTKRSMQYADFTSALDWAKEQIANGALTEAQAYQVLSAEGYSPELEQYVGEDWHRAVYEDLHVPMMFQQAGGAQLAMWEEMTPDERKKMASDMYDALSAEEKAAMFGDADWWKSDPTVYRTFGQAFEQQFAAILPGLATDLIASGAELGDMIGASFTGRPELNDSTKDWLKMQEFVQNYGSVYDDVNGTKVADVAASVVGEIARMQVLGMVGAGVGSAFEATGIGGKVAQLAAGNPGIVKKATGMALSLVRSSPFVVNAWAHDYAELKSLGASNSEAMWNSMITGMAEGVLEGFNFDSLWGKVLGQEAFATEILDAGKRAFGTAGIVWKARIANMAASGLGEFTEESIGYVLDTYLKMRHSDTWGKGTEWSASDWLSQAGMGFLVGAIGGGMASMDINASRILSEYAMSSEEGLRAVFPDVFVSDGVWDTANETVKASYRTGGATVLSDAAYKTLREQAEACVASAQKTLEAARADEADAQEKINNAESEVRKLEDKLAPYMLVKGRKESLTGEEAKEFGALYAKWNEAKRHAESVRNEVTKDLAEKAGNHERNLQNAESQLKDLQKKIQEHFCGIHLMNEGATPEQAFENMMNAYQNGFKVEGKAAQAVDTKTENAPETNATTETTKDEASAAAREAAYDRVYTDQEAGKAYGNETKNAKGRKLTRVEFAENERQNFQAKTTAKQGKVTLELAGLEAAEGMSDKEIIAEAKKAMTPDAAKKLDMFMKLSKALGMPMVIRDVVAGTSGYVHDGKLYVTLNGKQALLRVTAHELTHYMKDHVRTGYDALRTRLIDDVGGQAAFDELVQKKAQEYGLDLNTENGRLEADDEVCAELCEKMFENKDALEKFVNEAPEAAKTLKARLAKTLVTIKQAIKSLGTSSSETRADLIKDQDTIELWYKTLSDAIDAANAESKGKVQPTIEDVATETSTEAQPQAPPAPEGVEELGISAEEVRKQNLRSELEELAKKGTKVKDFDRASVNEILDRVIVGDRTNYSKADYAQIRGMLAQLIPEIKAMVDGDTSVDLDALNERVQTALNYMLDRYSEPSAELYDLREIIPGRIALTETAYNELRKNSQMTLREASNRMTRALGKFVNFVYKGSPNYSAASTIDEVWRDIGYEPEGQGTIAEDADALIKYVEERAERSSYDDLYGSQREDMVSAHAGEFLDAVQSMVDEKSAEQDNARHMADVSGENRNGQTPIKISDDSELARLLDNRGDESPKSVIARYIMSVFDGQAITMTDGRNVIVDNHDAGKLAQYPKPRKTAELSNIRKIIETAAYDHSDTNAIHNKFKEFHYYIGSVEYGKNTYDVELNVGVTKNDGTSHLYDIRDWQNNGTADSSETSPTMPGNNAGVSLTSGSFDNSITGNQQKGNTFTRDSLDDDYMPLAERYDAGIATEAQADELRADVEEAASDSMKDSVVRNQDGTMQRLYHGSVEDFTIFDKNKIRAVDIDAPFNGFWFSSSKDTSPAMRSSEFTKAVFLDIKNPAPYDVWRNVSKEVEREWLSGNSATQALREGARSVNDEVRYRLQDLGYDGIHYRGAYNFTEDNVREYNETGATTFSDAGGRLYDLRRSEYGDARLYRHNSYAEIIPYDSAENFYEDNNNEYREEDVWVAFEPNQVKSADLVTYDNDGNIIPLSERFDPNKVDTRWTVDDDWDEAVRRYGAKPQGMNPRARDVQVPERLNRQSRLSDFLRSLTESGKVTDDQVNDIKKMVVEQNYMSYIPTSVADRMEQAQKYIAQRQPLQAQQEFHDMVTAGKGGANTVALGIQLLSDAAERGDIESVLDTAADLQILATDSGQSVQAFSVLKQLKGVGSAWYMQKLVDRLNSKYADRIAAGKMDTITVSPELMAQLAAATNVNEIEAAEEAVAKEIAGQLPLTWTDRLSNWRYFSMLANPVTHFRNIFGNVLMGGMNMAKDVVATGLERTLNVADEDRAHAVLTAEDRKTWGDWAQKSYDENARNLRGGGKLGFETFVKQNMRSFDTKFLNALAKFNFDKLEGEDIRFIRPAYKNALMQYMKAQGYTLNAQGEVGKYAADGTFTPISNAKMTEAEEWASNQAWKATFRDASDLATMLNKVSKMNSVSRLLVEGVMPFKKTPVNIAKRGIEYSPAGIVMGVAQLTNGVKKGKYTPAQAIDTLASGLTGSALMALGVFLAKLGVIRGGGEDKKKYETYLEDTGDQTYAFKIGDVSINMSSIAPATIPLFMGVALEEMLNRQGDSFDLSTFTDTIAGTLNPLMEMSFMSSLNSALQNYNNNGIGGALGNTLLTAAQNYGSQYLPTAVARLGQLADPVQRTTKSSATSPIGGNMDYYVRSLAKKVPGATAALEPDVNVWGQTNTKDTYGERLLDVFNKFELPTNVKITNRDAVDKELIRLVESTGGVDFLPSDGNKYFTVSGQTYKMNARQYTEFSKERGEASYAAIKEVMNSPAYVNANDTQRADMLEKALKAAQKQVNTNWKYKLGAFD